jgi:8-oxo-dGTP diphosphatase
MLNFMQPASIGIILADTQVLLVKRRDVPIWVLPGGGIDKGETPEQAVIREVYEETGLRVEIERKTAEYLPINRFTSLAHVFLCRPISGQFASSAETSAIAYFPLDQLPPGFFAFHKEWLRDALRMCADMPMQRPLSRRTFWKILAMYALRPHIALRYLWTRRGSRC